ncbi:hypothetical protein B0E41_00025 [Hydrogenophaga sp. A37]|nr:hypothetical protein B0E41_00025 [Hydrogenophaga sp. A37]
MRKCFLIFIVFTLAAIGGCSTTQEIFLAKGEYKKKISTVVQVLEADNSPEMNKNLESALIKEGFSIKVPLPTGTRRSAEADAVVSYADVWRWDLAMYLRSLTVRLYDAETGDLLASGDWKDSPLHGFRDSKLVVEGVVSEMFEKVRAATKVTN